MLDIFALLVLLTLGITVVGSILLIGYLPGHIARQRGHTQAQAVNVCGWFGILTGGFLLPIAFIWAFWSEANETVPEKDKS